MLSKLTLPIKLPVAYTFELASTAIPIPSSLLLPPIFRDQPTAPLVSYLIIKSVGTACAC
ncbi:MAG: hypothetical protein HC908_06455 [Calothrix sp. SM1_7_51]|nr:hypothetical protein [Calothrix sp. SM1_7_51]